MCGIAGSTDCDRAFELYKSNLNRGYYSSGALIVKKDLFRIRKKQGVFEHALIGQPGAQADFYLYHSRGPTTETTNFIEDNNHPFVFNEWVVAHNGIISNFEELGKKYFPEENFIGKTDSCIIPRMLSVKSMKEVLEELKGTFTLWVWNKQTSNLYICRSANTLFVNFNNGDFCSTQFEGSVPLEEGFIYKVHKDCIQKETAFMSKSPYFVF